MSIECYDTSCHLHSKLEPFCHEDHCIDCCPACNSKDYIPRVVIHNIENYGSAVVTFKCLKCDAKVEAQIKRKLTTTIVSSKITNKALDWP